MSQFDGLEKKLSPFHLMKKSIDMTLSSIVCPMHDYTPTCTIAEGGDVLFSCCCEDIKSEIHKALNKNEDVPWV